MNWLDTKCLFHHFQPFLEVAPFDFETPGPDTGACRSLIRKASIPSNSLVPCPYVMPRRKRADRTGNLGKYARKRVHFTIYF